MVDAVDVTVSLAPPPTLFQQRLDAVLAVLRSELETQALACARQRCESVLTRSHVDRAVFNLLHHGQHTDLLTELKHECDAEGVLLADDPEDWDFDDDDATDLLVDSDWDLDDRVTLTELVDG